MELTSGLFFNSLINITHISSIKSALVKMSNRCLQSSRFQMHIILHCTQFKKSLPSVFRVEHSRAPRRSGQRYLWSRLPSPLPSSLPLPLSCLSFGEFLASCRSQRELMNKWKIKNLFCLRSLNKSVPLFHLKCPGLQFMSELNNPLLN